MSHTWMSHITHMNESAYVTSHIRMRNVVRINESCRTHGWVMSQAMQRGKAQRKAHAARKTQVDLQISHHTRHMCYWFMSHISSHELHSYTYYVTCIHTRIVWHAIIHVLRDMHSTQEWKNHTPNATNGSIPRFLGLPGSETTITEITEYKYFSLL